ncbi:MAG: hypothetical protein ACKVI6_04135 [Candidatus Poseidoniales archaeon]|jgi:hypothetical protein|tara:strand:+ start:2266 stop:3213 length:948 start_codon:yes stop_codon:yes gene_type:complete
MSGDEDIEEQLKNFPFPLPPPPPGITLPTPPGMPAPPPIFLNSDSTEPLGAMDQTLLDAANALDFSNSLQTNTDFKSIWEKRKANDPTIRSDNKQSMYGHIDRIAKGEVGTLLDRFQDRFGSELDREIIVLRKKEQQEMRSIKPTVELISVPEKDDSMTLSEFMESMKDDGFLSKVSEVTNIPVDNLSNLSNNELKNFFKSADNNNSGTVDFNEFVEAILELDDSKDEFQKFFNIVNDLLGDASEDFINSFVGSTDFKLFEQIGANPQSSSNEDRNSFFIMINKVLGDLPPDSINDFVNSPDFDIFTRMGELYGE